MKILYLCADTGIPVQGAKGAAVHVREMTSAFGRLGHTVLVAAPMLVKSPWDVGAPLNARVMHLPLDDAMREAVQNAKAYCDALGAEAGLPGALRRVLGNAQIVQKLVQAFDGHKPDFIFERASLFSTAGALAARALGVPLVVELNAPLAQEQAAFRDASLTTLAHAAEAHTLSQADAVFAVSEPLRAHVIALGAAPERVHVLPNGVDPHQFYPAPRRADVRARFGIGSGRLLGFVGGLRPWHDVAVLPSLLKNLCERHADLHMLIVGDGPVRKALHSRFADAGLASRVTFTDWLPHDQVADVVREFDIALAPYRETGEPFYFSPLKLFEYMACGVPVVAARIGQIADVIEHGVHGLTYAPGDLADLTAACDSVLRQPELAASMGRAASTLMLRDFTWEANARRVCGTVAGLATANATPMASISRQPAGVTA